MRGNTGGGSWSWQSGGRVRTRHERYNPHSWGPPEAFEAQTALRDLDGCADEEVEEVLARYLVARSLLRWASGAASDEELARERGDAEACLELLPEADAEVLRVALHAIGGPELAAAQAAFAAAAAAFDRNRPGGAWALAAAALDLAVTAGESWLAAAAARHLAAIARAAGYGDDVVTFWQRTANRLDTSRN